MSIKRGVNFYSYQQAMFFKQLDMEGCIKETAENCFGATGIEINEALRGYPDPSEEYVRNWFSWIEEYNVTPVMMDTYMDVLQYRDHVMSYHECAERLAEDIRLAKRLGIQSVKCSAVVPFDVIKEALPVAEELDIKIGKEIHQPIPLNGQYVREILEYIYKNETKHLGIVPDFGIFQFRPSDVALDYLVRHGASQTACDRVNEICDLKMQGKGPLYGIDLSMETTANVESYFHTFLKSGECKSYYLEAFRTIKEETERCVEHPTNADYEVMLQSLLYSPTEPKDIAPLVPYIIAIHGKAYNMTEIPDRSGHYTDKAVNNAEPIHYLKAAGYNGYINTEYEGQRKFQDLPFDRLANEIDQVRKHQKMLARLIEEA